MPIFIGGAIRGIVDSKKKKSGIVDEEEDLGKGNLYATGLVAGGAIGGVIVAILFSIDSVSNLVKNWSLEAGLTEGLGETGFFLLGVAFFALMGIVLYRIARKPSTT